jgi:hypothetical protein
MIRKTGIYTIQNLSNKFRVEAKVPPIELNAQQSIGNYFIDCHYDYY